jgi:hypothetical protein
LIRSARKRSRVWVLLLLPGLFLRSLVPLGFMPMFGPGFSVGLMLCPAYAPIPDVATASSSIGKGARTTADMSADMPGMDMSMPSAKDAPEPAPRGAPGSGTGTDHQYDSLYHYLANAVGAALSAWFDPFVAEQPATALSLPTPQVTFFKIPPRAQSARAPPFRV